jgi:hypothetical protein
MLKIKQMLFGLLEGHAQNNAGPILDRNCVHSEKNNKMVENEK